MSVIMIDEDLRVVYIVMINYATPKTKEFYRNLTISTAQYWLEVIEEKYYGTTN
jgi:hypothetical protein